MRQVLITGAKGQLGSTLIALGKQESDFNCVGVDIDDFDLTDGKALEKCIVDNSIEIIVNCAAYTAVNQAETEPQLATAINSTAVATMGELVARYGLTWIHISTDYVFDGRSTQAYKPDDSPNPLNVYGYSKWLGEEAIKKLNPNNTMILRTSWLYGDNNANFVATLFEQSAIKKEIEVVADQVGSPTYCDDLAQAIWNMLPQFSSKGHTIYHYANDGRCSWFEFAQSIVRMSKHDCTILPKMTTDATDAIKRPKFSVLDTEKFQKAFDVSIPHWEASLKICLNKKIMK